MFQWAADLIQPIEHTEEGLANIRSTGENVGIVLGQVFKVLAAGIEFAISPILFMIDLIQKLYALTQMDWNDWKESFKEGWRSTNERIAEEQAARERGFSPGGGIFGGQGTQQHSLLDFQA